MKVWNEEWKSTKNFQANKNIFPELNPKQSEFLLLLRVELAWANNLDNNGTQHVELSQTCYV